MLKRFVVCVGLLLVAGWLVPARAFGQGPDPAAQVSAALVGSGYDVVEVGYFPDAQGNPTTDSVYALLETITTNFNDRYLTTQALRTFSALAKYYPNAEYYIAALRYDRWIYFFITSAPDLDDYAAERMERDAFWAQVSSQARVYDSVEQKYITAKDFTSQDHTNKNQTDKDFSGLPDSPLPPINADPNAQAENILLEPSTTYLPADGTTQGYLLATLTDRSHAGLPGRGVNFTFEIRGQEEKALGTAQTDRYGTARSTITSSRPLDLVLLRASTATLNASTQIVVGAPPGNDVRAQEQAVIEGLASQGYTDADAAYAEQTGPNGQEYRLGIAAVRVTSKTFDREVYSQLARMMGTVRTVMPNANILRPLLLYAAADGHDYALLFNLSPEIWDAYLRGDIGENQLWSSLAYDGAVNENGVRTDQKDFLTKNFSGAQQTKYSSATREVVSTLTNESWGEQLTVGSFLVPVGGYADGFHINEQSGAATGFAIYATPDYNTPVFQYSTGDDAALSALRLDSGQYIVQVLAPNPPARIVIPYTEHLAR